MRGHRRAATAVLAAAVVAVVVLVVLRPELAAGCSCVNDSHPRDSLAAADAAFIGDLVECRPVDPPRRGEPESLGDHVYTFRVVTEAIKGSLGPTVDVVSGANGASCGISPRYLCLRPGPARGRSRSWEARAQRWPDGFGQLRRTRFTGHLVGERGDHAMAP